MTDRVHGAAGLPTSRPGGSPLLDGTDLRSALMTTPARLAAAASLLMLAAHGQEPALHAATPQAPSFTSAADLVVMNVVVRDRQEGRSMGFRGRHSRCTRMASPARSTCSRA